MYCDISVGPWGRRTLENRRVDERKGGMLTHTIGREITENKIKIKI